MNDFVYPRYHVFEFDLQVHTTQQYRKKILSKVQIQCYISREFPKLSIWTQNVVSTPPPETISIEIVCLSLPKIKVKITDICDSSPLI